MTCRSYWHLLQQCMIPNGRNTLSESNPRRAEVLAAKEAEINGLQGPQVHSDGTPGGSPCLVELFPGDPRYELALKIATRCRMLLDLKRSNMYKVRMVVQGFLLNRVAVDGADFLYSSSVARMSTVRGMLLQPRRGEKVFATIDISQAFLQSIEFTEEEQRYVKVFDPVTGKMRYFLQLRPLYGEPSAPVRWESTLASFLTAPESEGGLGFVRGSNDRSVYYHPVRKFAVLVYVDDIGVLALREDCKWFFSALAKRFKVKEPVYAEDGAPPLDYLGLSVAARGSYLY